MKLTRTALALKKLDFIDISGNMRKLTKAIHIVCLSNIRKEQEVFLK